MLHCPDTRSHADNVLQAIVARPWGIVWTASPCGIVVPVYKTLYNRPYATIYHAPLVCIPHDRIDSRISQCRPIVGHVLRVATHCFDSRATFENPESISATQAGAGAGAPAHM